ncbi:uncharacterized protein LOC115926014 [Strongylocentrotus purpuratus]|uniref:Snake toxin/toxin-like domain-containing protein n=1 Tax=Strongylocentrotus purpuratus TaxID=7668 RepID=A0A7M7G3K2_STRPU|nr:uncharacterized protein LOC752895 [Strongylocentrotus purpuratus]XP_030846083.1 uncharacterized protein LOC115926014 [Strongylocentrotus purpuratus]|eukprot:XP_001180492.2 PREDICTED: uncharacterized protein LOC752895 [Strongylocentrotus purpuratus]
MKTFITLFVLAVCVAPLYALDCYTCGFVSGFGGEVCKDTFDIASLNSSSDVTTSTCSGSCAKTVVTVNGEVTAVTRSCSGACTAGCISFFGIKTCTNCCTGEYCNGATNVHMSIIAIMAALLVALGFSR